MQSFERAIQSITVDDGVITSGACATPVAQAEFDENEMGKPPTDEEPTK